MVSVACSLYVSRNLGMNTDTTDMLSEHLPFRVNMKHYNETFPQDMDTLLVVLEAPTPEQAYMAASVLQHGLKQDTVNFHDVYPPNVDDFFYRNGLLYESVPELEHITDRLAAAQPLMAHIAENPTLHTFAAVLSRAVDELREGTQHGTPTRAKRHERDPGCAARWLAARPCHGNPCFMASHKKANTRN